MEKMHEDVGDLLQVAMQNPFLELRAYDSLHDSGFSI